MADIFREVDEELQRDRLIKLWKRYGGLIIGLAVAVVVVTAARVAWDAYQTSEREKRAAQFAEALEQLQSGDLETAAGAFDTLGDRGNAQFEGVARFAEAEALAQADRPIDAANTYLEIADGKGLDPLYRDLALVKWGWHEVERQPLAILEARLGPLLESDSVWRHSAREILGYAAFRGKDYGQAKNHYEFLQSAADTPDGVRQRASDMLQVIQSVDREGNGDEPTTN